MKYRVMIGTTPEKNYDIETTDKKIRKLFVDLKKKYKGTGILMVVGKYREDGKLYGFLRN